MNKQPFLNYAKLRSEFIDIRFDLESKSEREEKESDYLLSRVLNFRLKDCFGSFKKEHFFHYLYEPRVFRKYYKELLHKVNSDLRYHFVHSYAKNGKSTFVKYFCYNRERKDPKSKFVFFDLGETSQNQSLAIDKRVKEFLKGYYITTFKSSKFSELTEKNPLIWFFKHISNDENFDKDVTGNNSYFNAIDTFNQKIGSKVLNYSYGYEKSNKKVKLFNYSEFVEDIWELPFSTNELFSFLVTIQAFSFAKYDEVYKVLYTFDNLDDIQSYLPENVSLSYITELINFHDYITKAYPNLYMCKDQKYLDIDFIFVYRTSNFLSTIYKSQPIKETHISRIINHPLNINNVASKVMITSVKSSDEIAIKRIRFYYQLCRKFKLPISNKVKLLEDILNSFNIIENKIVEKSYSEKRRKFDIDKFLRFWNGNKSEFYKFLFESEFKKFEIKIFKSTNHPEIMTNISTGLIIHKVLKYFHSHKNTSNTTYKVFLDFTTGSYAQNILKERCCLVRLFFAYLLNNRPLISKNESINDVYKYGVSLYDFLMDLKKLTKNVVYTSEDFSSLFKTLNKFEFDNWGKFISSCSSTYVKNVPEKEAAKSITGDIEPKYVREIVKLMKEDNTDEFSKIRFYLNDAGLYFMFKMKRSFEYFSFCINSSNKSLPESLEFKILKNNEYNELYSSVLFNVYNRIIECTEVTVKFLKNSIAMNIVEYCESKWTFNSKIFFDDLISKVISYIEDVRYAAIQGFIDIKCPESQIEVCKNDINKKFTLNIEMYLNLFDKLYFDLDENLPTSLLATKSRFKILRDRVNEIKIDYTNWDIRINTNEDEDTYENATT